MSETTSTRGPQDRFQWDEDGDTFDEVALSNVVVHMERMSHHGWWMVIRDPETDESVDFWWHATGEPVIESSFKSAKVTIGGALLYDCQHKWTDRREGGHRCEVEKAGHVWHRCECGARRKADHRTESEEAS